MLTNKGIYSSARSLLWSGVIGLFILTGSVGQSQPLPLGESLSWKSKARLHRPFRSTHGDLLINDDGVEFRPLKGLPLRLSFTDLGITSFKSVAVADIKSVRISPRRVILISYQSNGWWHRPGEREFRFDLETPVSAAVAAEMIGRIGKPSINGIPNPQTPSFATVPARHRRRTGGSNGVLRLRDDGIDYLDSAEKDSRSWRWADIETLANPDAYHFRVGGYLETFEFELKQPMSQQLFGRLWDALYGRDLNVGVRAENGANRTVGAGQNGGNQER